MHVRGLVALLCLAALGALGCQTENTTDHKETAREQKGAPAPASSSASSGPPPRVISNDAGRILEACGRPEIDTVTVLHDKLHDGPVRLMVYHGRQIITVELIPWGDSTRPVTPDTLWRFQAAHMENREYLTSKHLGIYLPCAASALADEL